MWAASDAPAGALARNIATMGSSDMMSARESMNLAWVGIVLAVLGNVLLAVGFVLQKISHNAFADARAPAQKEPGAGDGAGAGARARAGDGDGDGDGADGVQAGDCEDGGMPQERFDGEHVGKAYGHQEDGESGGGMPGESGESESTSQAATGDAPSSGSMERPGRLGAKVLDEVYYVKSKTWWSGLGLIFIGEVMNAGALAFASGSVVPPIGALALVFIAVLSYFILHERPSLLNWAGLVVSVVGVALVGAYAPKGQTSEAVLSAGEAALLTRMPRFYVFALVMAFLFFGLCISLVVRPGSGERHVLIYASLAGLAGMFKTRSIKVILQMFGDTVSSERNAFKSPVFWAYAALAVATTLSSLYFLNKGQAAFRQTLIVPVYFCVFSTLSVLSANLFYDEFSDTDFNIPAYVAGLSFLIAGVLLFSVPASISPGQVLRFVKRRVASSPGESPVR